MTIGAVFARAGYAALSDFSAGGYGELFARLEPVQREFMDQVPAFRSAAYGWENDTLHTWSRAWEYPYTLHHLTGVPAAGALPAIADFGSGSTFFPIAVARGGANVVCFDNDPVCVAEMAVAARALGTGAGTVDVRRNDARLPAADASFDAAYSVSVLEHMPDPVPVVAEIARVLRPGGRFVVTMDIDVEGASGVPARHFERIREELAARFSWVFPERTIHPQDVLTSRTSPWPRPGERHVPGLLLRTADRRLLPLLGGPSPGVLTVYAAVLQRRELP